MKYQNANPDCKKQGTRNFTSPESPSNVWNIVQEDIRKWRISFRVRNTLMNYNHDESCYPSHQKSIACENEMKTLKISDNLLLFETKRKSIFLSLFFSCLEGISSSLKRLSICFRNFTNEE